MTPSSLALSLFRSIVRWLFKKRRLNNKSASSDAIKQANIVIIEEILEEVNDAADAVNIVHQGLEDLKLGSISVSYAIFIDGARSRSSSSGGGGHLIASGSITGSHTITYIEAYVSRGYRTHWDHDRTQGRGVAGVMSSALSSYSTFPW